MTNIPDDSSLPASVRNAPDLSQHGGYSGSETGAASAQQGPSWRFEVAGADDFQKYVQMSGRGAVIFALYAESSPASLETVDTLEQLVNSAQGSLLLATVDITRHPEIAQAFQVQGVPAAVAVIAGQPAPLFNSQVSSQQMTDVVQQVLQVAASQQLTGGFEPAVAEEDKPLDPLHQEAVDAIDRGNYEAASAAYHRALSENPGDHDAKIGLAQVGLLSRVQGLDANAARKAAADEPEDVEAALQVADLDLVGGHVDDSFNRLIGLFSRVPAEDKNRIRERLLELFEVVGAQDPRVLRARSALMTAIF